MIRWSRYIMVLGLGWLIGCMLNDELDRVQIGIGVFLIFVAMVLWRIGHQELVAEIQKTQARIRYIEDVFERLITKAEKGSK